MIISEMQRRLATWAATDPSRRIERLLRLITQPEWLAEAARITLSSKGAHTPGVDGVNKAKLEARLAVELQILRDELLSGHYQPLPARRVYIPRWTDPTPVDKFCPHDEACSKASGLTPPR